MPGKTKSQQSRDTKRKLGPLEIVNAILDSSRRTSALQTNAAARRHYGDETRKSEITPESLFSFIHHEEFKIELNRDFLISAMFDQAEKVTLAVATMDWMVVHASEGSSFITAGVCS
jgi:hypothetical protein